MMELLLIATIVEAHASLDPECPLKSYVLQKGLDMMLLKG